METTATLYKSPSTGKFGVRRSCEKFDRLNAKQFATEQEARKHAAKKKWVITETLGL